LKSFTFYLLFLWIFTFSVEVTAQEKQSTFQNFSKTQLLQEKGVQLDSNWEFYWDEFITPNNFESKKPLNVVKLASWTNYLDNKNNKLPAFGYATYRTKFSIPKERQNVSLYIPRIIASYKIWVNGVFILETGRVGKSRSETLQRRFIRIIPLDAHDTDFEVVIQVANFYNKKAGITESILLGTSQQLLKKQSLQIMVDMISIGSFSFIGIVFLVFYFLYWNKDQAVLYFAVLCISLSYHTLNDRYAPFSVVFDEISWVLLAKIEYLAVYIAGLAGSLFFALILKDFINKWYTKIVISITLLFTVLLILLPAPYFTELVLPFLGSMLLNILFIIYITFKAIFAKKKESKLLLVSIIFASVTFSANVLFFIYENEIGLIYAKFGYLFMFLFISMLLLQRFSNSFKKLAKANAFAVKQKEEIYNMNLKLADSLKILKNSNEELDDFNHIVSHDLKTPLVSVYSLATFIEEDLENKINADTKNHLVMIKDVISKMEASINGLLTYSKVSKESKSKEVFSFHELLTKVIGLIDFQKKSTINLPKNDVEIKTNKIELEHVFQNLISNSIKYNNKEKIIIDIHASKKGNEYLFSVSDNGPGIDEKYHEKIFKIFNQLEVNTKDVESTGVGLAIVKKIISKNNGIIKVTSEKDKGLTISFTWQIENNTKNESPLNS
jgi:signal transduction histidine kinase